MTPVGDDVRRKEAQVDKSQTRRTLGTGDPEDRPT